MSIQTFPLSDHPSLAEQKALLGENVTVFQSKKIVAVFVGEYREPKKGEWYISGAIAEAYKAPNDLSMKFHIAKLITPDQLPKCPLCHQVLPCKS